jgi:superfamily II DNA or RNA helicase
MHAARGYQQTLIDQTMSFWAQGGKNALAVLPTGGGKTFVFSRIASLVNTAVCAMAHRGELVSQISTALAREGVRHRIIGPAALSRRCTSIHLDKFGRDFVQPNSRIAVAGVDTLINRSAQNDPWFAQVGLWIGDEAHHFLRGNKWGKAADMFPNARGLGVTATPIRADGKGLGSHADGVFDQMFVGPTMRELIDQGFLTEYRIFAPPSDIDLSNVGVAADGDYNKAQVAQARKRSHITGDVVQHYLRIARGKRGVTFDVDIESATLTAKAFRDAGVPAEVVHGETPDAMRAEILRRFEAGEVLQLVNVDLFGEGFDLPAIEVVSFARPTMSFALYAQQFGRALRILAGKQWAIIIDHVGNCLKHGLPDGHRVWSLDRRERRSRSAPNDVIPTRTCVNLTPSGEMCMGVYERTLLACPYCGHAPVPAGRSAPELVDGDLMELDPDTLRRMRGEIARVDGAPLFPAGAGPEVRGAIARNHWERQQAQAVLRRAIALWAGWHKLQGHGDQESYRRFYFRYGIDVASAQALNAADAGALATRIEAELSTNNVREMT